jgi:hypothetical protein
MYGDNRYSAFAVDTLIDEAKMVTKLQNLLKSSYLILEHGIDYLKYRGKEEE